MRTATGNGEQVYTTDFTYTAEHFFYKRVAGDFEDLKSSTPKINKRDSQYIFKLFKMVQDFITDSTALHINFHKLKTKQTIFSCRR